VPRPRLGLANYWLLDDRRRAATYFLESSRDAVARKFPGAAGFAPHQNRLPKPVTAVRVVFLGRCAGCAPDWNAGCQFDSGRPDPNCRTCRSDS
jgi:hypothetical protein